VTAVEITSRDRVFSAPPLGHAVRATFGGEIEVLGYELVQKEAHLELTLFWRAHGYIRRDYKYFVHLWQGERVVAQVDSMPADWQYPTSWWAPGEVVSERVLFDVGGFDSDDVGITTGFYDSATGERLGVALADGTVVDAGWVTLLETPDD
jgi:hypothetical protein